MIKRATSEGCTHAPILPKRRRCQPNWGLIIMAIPGLVVLLAMYYVPLFGLVIPFKQIDYSKGILGSDWADPFFKNFLYFFKSQDAWRVTWNTVSMNAIFIAVTMVVSVFLAICMYNLGKQQVKIYQTCMFVPYFISWVVASYVVYALLCPGMGVLPSICKAMGIPQPNFYNMPKYWRVILPVAYLWKNIGYNTLLFYATLMGMSTTMFEASAIDGANRRQRTRYIILPYLKPTIILMTLLQIGKIFNADFGMFYFLPRNSGTLYPVTDVIDTYVYRALRVTGDIGMSSALGLFQSCIGFVLVLLANYIVRKIDEDSSLF